jgi:hypothetical protein
VGGPGLDPADDSLLGLLPENFPCRQEKGCCQWQQPFCLEVQYVVVAAEKQAETA